MKLGIMQPYFLPYLGYFSLIKHTDAFILLDEVQFMRHGWIERNRILKPNDGWQYIQVPLIKHSQKTSIKNTEINNVSNWKNKILSQLQHYKKKAPYYNNTKDLLENIFSKDFDSITALNFVLIKEICQYLDINNQIHIYSEMNLNIDIVESPDEWALNICKAYGNVSQYLNPIGGMSFFDKSKYNDAGIALSFQKMNIKEYNQNRSCFEPALSIIDVMMFCSSNEIYNMLDDFEYIE